MVAFLIVSYNKSRYLINAVTSIRRFCPEAYTILIYEGHPDQDNQNVFRKWMENTGNRDDLMYVTDGDNLGYCRAYNWMSNGLSEYVDTLILLSEDMFFGPQTIASMLYVIRNCSEVGIVTASYTPPLFDRLNPKLEDIDVFADRYQHIQIPSYDYLGFPFPMCMKLETWENLCEVDVWENLCLPFNRYNGAFDESIDPSPMGWASDWDLIARLQPLGLRKAILIDSHIYHYDHVSGEAFDKADSGWSEWAIRNYAMKYPTGSRVSCDDQCFQKIPWNSDFGKFCPAPWASKHQILQA